MDLRQRMKDLADQVRAHRHRYYVLDQPVLSDAEYDALERELRDLEVAHPDLSDPNSPTLRVGAPPIDAFEKRRHAVPMLSLDNAYSEAELREWEAKWRRLAPEAQPRYAAELKVDGLSLSLRYQNRLLVEALTRGDGETGELVTENARTLSDIPLRLPEDAPESLTVRGEVFLSRKRWEELNRQRDARGEARFANPRNAASGTMKLLDSREVAARGLSFLPWQVLWGEGQADDHARSMARLGEWGFGVMPGHATGDLEVVLAFISTQAEARLKLPFDTDGVVLKILETALQQRLGATDRVPRWAIAFKYPATQVTTTVLGITWQVGRTGKLTPVAELEAVEVAGSTVRRATLHNADELARLGLKIGHRVFIEKGGEVIPKVVALVPGEEQRDLPLPVIPATCPVCGGEVGKADDAEVAIRCLNPECPAKLVARLLHFGGRAALDIEGMGEALVEQLVASGRIEQPWEIFAWLVEPRSGLAYLSGLERMAEKSAQNVMDALAAARTKPLSRWIHALGIPNVGESSADLLARGFSSLESLWEADEFVFAGIESIGPEVGRSVRAFVSSHPGLPTWLKAHGVRPSLELLPPVPTISLEAWLTTIGIPELGLVTARKLIERAGDMSILWSMTADEVMEMGLRHKLLNKKQVNIPNQLAQFSRNHPVIPRQLEQLGLKLSGESRGLQSSLPLEGMTVVVTGTLPSLSREDAEGMLAKLGAKVVGSVSSKTSVLVAGDKAGSKLEKAISLGVSVKNEDWLLGFIKGDSNV